MNIKSLVISQAGRVQVNVFPAVISSFGCHCLQVYLFLSFSVLDEIKQFYLQYHEIFIDGSKVGDKVSVACIFIVFNFSHRINLPPNTSIFTAELAAIKLALIDICKTKYKQHIIFSYSISALQAISHQHNIHSANIIHSIVAQ